MNQKKAGTGKITAVSLALIAGAAYGVGGTVSQVITQHGFMLTQYVLAQFVSAIVILGVLTLIWFRNPMPFKEVLKLMAIGIFSAVSSFSYYIAIDLLSVGQAVAFQFQYVWIAVVIQAVIERTLPKKWTVVSAILIIVGTLFGSGLFEEIISGGITMNPVGLFAAALCAFFYAIFLYANGRVATEYHAVPRSLYLCCGGLITALVAVPFFGLEPCNIIELAPWGILMGLLMLVIPAICIVVSSTALSGGIVAILTSTELPVAVLSGCLILGEGITPIRIVGLVIIIVSIVLSRMDDFKKPSKELENQEEAVLS